MRNKDPKRILKSKTDLTEGEIEELSAEQAWEIIYSLHNNEKDARSQICFTGFSKSESEHLKDIAILSDWRVVGSVTRKLNILVVGDTPGPAKVSQAKKQSTIIMNKSEYLKKFR